MLKYTAKFIIALNGNLSKAQIAAGFSWGLFLGLVPSGNLFWIVFFLLSFFFKIHHASKLLCMAILKLCSGALAPMIDIVGWEVLHIQALQPLFTTLYNMPFVPFTRFNNTLVAGGIVSGIIIWLPVFLVVFLLVPVYRHKLAPKIRENKLVKSIKNVPLVSKIQKLASKAVSLNFD